MQILHEVWTIWFIFYCLDTVSIFVGKFTQESQVLAKMEHEKEQARSDPWKVRWQVEITS